MTCLQLLVIYVLPQLQIGQVLTRSEGIVQLRPKGGEVRAAVGEDEGVGSPGVGSAHVEGVGGWGADVPRGVQAVHILILAYGLGAVWVVFAEALVHVAVVDDGLWWGRGAGCGRGWLHGQAAT
jgi:hypothetical protein